LKIAIVKLNTLGDIIHTMPVLQFIKKKIDKIDIDWIVDKSLSSILSHNPHIDNIIKVDLQKITKNKFSLFSEIKKIKDNYDTNYDLIIDTQGNLISATISKMLGKNSIGFSASSIKNKFAPLFYKEKIDVDFEKSFVDRNCELVSKALDIQITQEEILNKEPFLFYKKRLRLNTCFNIFRKNIVFVIGSTWASRNYPKENFAKLADMLKENVMIIWGNEKERERAEWIEKNTLYAKSLPKLSLNALKEVIDGADLVIGNDTGPTHMAWALNRKSITIFGPTSENRVYQTPINRVIKSKSAVNMHKINKKDFSIKDIDPKDIYNIAQELLY